jgi:hypothetical protein
MQTFPDTSHSLPSKLPVESGEDELERKIRIAAEGLHLEEAEKRDKEKEARKKKEFEERKNAERALGEFMGYEMWPTPKAEFKGATHLAVDTFEFRVGGLVFKLNRITSNVESNDHGNRLKRRDYAFAVTSEYERIYGSRRLRKLAEAKRGSPEWDEMETWEWYSIDSLADIPTLRGEGKLEDH